MSVGSGKFACIHVGQLGMATQWARKTIKNFEKWKWGASEEINPPLLWEQKVELELGELLISCKNLLVFG